MSRHISRNGAKAPTRLVRTVKIVTPHETTVHVSTTGKRVVEKTDHLVVSHVKANTQQAGCFTITVIQHKARYRREWSRLMEALSHEHGATFQEVDRVGDLVSYRVNATANVLRALDQKRYCCDVAGKLIKGIETHDRAVPRQCQGAGAVKLVKHDIRNQQERYETVQGKTVRLSHTTSFDRSGMKAAPVLQSNPKEEYVEPLVKDRVDFGRLSAGARTRDGKVNMDPKGERTMYDETLLVDVDMTIDHFSHFITEGKPEIKTSESPCPFIQQGK